MKHLKTSLALMALTGIFLSACSKSDLQQNKKDFTEDEIFTGVVLKRGPVANAVPQLREAADKIASLKMPADAAAKMEQLQNELLTAIRQQNPSYLAQFKAAMTSGNPYKVEEALRGSTSILKQVIAVKSGIAASTPAEAAARMDVIAAKRQAIMKVLAVKVKTGQLTPAQFKKECEVLGDVNSPIFRNIATSTKTGADKQPDIEIYNALDYYRNIDLNWNIDRNLNLDLNTNLDLNLDLNTNLNTNVDLNTNLNTNLNVNTNVNSNLNTNVNTNLNTDVNIDLNLNLDLNLYLDLYRYNYLDLYRYSYSFSYLYNYLDIYNFAYRYDYLNIYQYSYSYSYNFNYRYGFSYWDFYILPLTNEKAGSLANDKLVQSITTSLKY